MYHSPVKTYYVAHTSLHQMRPQRGQQQQQQKLDKARSSRGFVLGRKRKQALRGLATLLTTCLGSQDALAGKEFLGLERASCCLSVQYFIVPVALI